MFSTHIFACHDCNNMEVRYGNSEIFKGETGQKKKHLLLCICMLLVFTLWCHLFSPPVFKTGIRDTVSLSLSCSFMGLRLFSDENFSCMFFAFCVLSYVRCLDVNIIMLRKLWNSTLRTLPSFFTFLCYSSTLWYHFFSRSLLQLWV